MTTRRKTPPSKPKRAVGYVRISVDRDNETSTETQEERIRAYCTAHAWSIVDVIVEPGRSAYKSSRATRPGFQRAKNVISSGAADVLVCWKLDRVGRNVVDIRNLVDELAEYDAQFVSVTESFDTATATGTMMLTVLSALAEMESATKSERVQEWQKDRRTSLATPTGPRPFGYKRDRNKLHVVDEEAEVIRQAADWILQGYSLRSIVADLDAAGVLGKNGTPISHRALRAILLGPTIVACREVEPGVFVASKEWKPILTRKKWDRVRDVLLDPSRTTGPGNRRRWLLSGIAQCGRCDTPMWSKPHNAGQRYFCPQCHLSIEQQRTDDIVQADLLAMLDAKTWRRLRRGQPTTHDRSGFEEAMTELSARFVSGDVDAAELAQIAEGLRRQQEVVAAPPPQLPNVDDVKKAWPKLTLEQRRLVLIAATEGLTIKPWTPSGSFDETRIVWTPVA